MILAEVRSAKLHKAGEPHPAPSWEAAKVAFGRLLVEHNVPDDDGYSLFLVGDWSPETGTKSLRRARIEATAQECKELYSPAPVILKNEEVEL